MQLRLPELKITAFRMLLCYVFYQICRLLFLCFQYNSYSHLSVMQYLKIAYYGLAFDTSAIIYTNALFLLASLLPLVINTSATYQRILFWIYMVCNGIGLALNCIDLAYYPFSQSRLTYAAYDVVKNEKGGGLLSAIVKTALPILILYILLIYVWQILYKKIKLSPQNKQNSWLYFASSIVYIITIGALAIGGVRGDFKHSTRPINLLDASRHVSTNAEADLVLNSTFSFIRTLGKNTYHKLQLLSDANCENVLPSKQQYAQNTPTKKNVVLFIVESFSKEYLGFLNTNSGIQNYQGYTPFLDTFSKHCLCFSNAYANGRQSIHGMSSILAGIPSFESAFTSSIYVHQPIESAVSIANKMGYSTNFFHGAYNGSMGFLGFGNILGMQHYYGKDNYPNQADYDGIWGIWDEPFMQYMKRNLDTMQQPFFSTLFTLSSHHPFNVPTQYANLPSGNKPIDKCVRYTDIALKNFFDSARHSAWFANTIFIITADHCNVPYFKNYTADINRFAVPILIYDPSKISPTGIDTTIAQQIDIYPTIVDAIGYNQAFRTWGNSLLQPNRIPYAVNSNSKDVNLVFGNYYYVFDGKNVTHIYTKNDIYKTTDLVQTEFATKQKGIQLVKAFMQSYMQKIMDKQLQ